MLWHGYYGWSSWPMMGGLVFLGCMVLLIAWGIHHAMPRTDGSMFHGKSPLDYLKERYARGEITKEQFEEIKRDLLS